MKTNPLSFTRHLLIALAATALLMAAGCEDASTDAALTVTPESTTLEGAGASVVLVASFPEATASSTNASGQLLVLPLTWEVGNANLGTISRNGGYSAVYVSSGRTGPNTVFVRDGFGREGVAVVNQVKPAPVATTTTTSP